MSIPGSVDSWGERALMSLADCGFCKQGLSAPWLAPHDQLPVLLWVPLSLLSPVLIIHPHVFLHPVQLSWDIRCSFCQLIIIWISDDDCLGLLKMFILLEINWTHKFMLYSNISWIKPCWYCFLTKNWMSVFPNNTTKEWLWTYYVHAVRILTK